MKVLIDDCPFNVLNAFRKDNQIIIRVKSAVGIILPNDIQTVYHIVFEKNGELYEADGRWISGLKTYKITDYIYETVSI